MRANRSKDTKPELTLRRALWAAGLRGYRKNVRKLPGTPDVVFGRARLAVLVHGCYWHSCPTCARNRVPKTNAAYWEAKFAGNRERDARNLVALEVLGYRIHVVWECELKKGGVEAVVALIGELLGSVGDVEGESKVRGTVEEHAAEDGTGADTEPAVQESGGEAHRENPSEFGGDGEDREVREEKDHALDEVRPCQGENAGEAPGDEAPKEDLLGEAGLHVAIQERPGDGRGA